MGSNTHQNFPSPNSPLLRFRSAPSSLLANFADGIDSGGNKGPESERLVSRFLNHSAGGESESSPGFHELESKFPVGAAVGNRMNCPNDYFGRPPHYPRQNSTISSSSSSSVSSSHGLLGSNLTRQSSSPAGVFSHLSHNGYGTMRDEVSPSPNRLNSQTSFSSIIPSSLGLLSQISEVDVKLANSSGEALFFNPSSFPFPSWTETSHFPETFAAVKRDPDSHSKLFSTNQTGEIGNRVHLLSHHLSLPKNSSDLASIEKLMQFQDAVPCRIRAKRGCATHPRSIAERVRRTRISERMRKLQELVPNMDKQTNTADMLDFAVDYIKDLQKRHKTLSDNRANCKCMCMQDAVSSQII